MRVRRGSWLASIILVGGTATLQHEAGHWLGFELSGIPARISFNHTYYLDHWAPSLAGDIGGPLATLLLSYCGLVLIGVAAFREFGAALAIGHATSRLLAYIVIVLTGSIRWNDEGVAALYLGWPDWTFVLLLAPLFILALGLSWRRLSGSRLQRAKTFAAVILAVAVLGGVETEILDPRLFPDAPRRELVLPAPQ
ncbi:MAG TPA: hypothetical protein VEU77_02390 [Candidatus Acidoferrales bacterium]|nr:hypothetical protein [Candidatus Acidoferrales bacterium]